METPKGSQIEWTRQHTKYTSSWELTVCIHTIHTTGTKWENKESERERDF